MSRSRGRLQLLRWPSRRASSTSSPPSRWWPASAVTELELVPGVAEGWRVWRVERAGAEPVLSSIARPFRWPAGRPMEGWCASGQGCPCVVHPCGLWAFYDEEHARRLMRHYATATRGLYMLGRVHGAGRVVYHEDGWRAARAVVVSIEDWSAGTPELETVNGRDIAAEIAGRVAVLYGVDELVNA